MRCDLTLTSHSTSAPGGPSGNRTLDDLLAGQVCLLGLAQMLKVPNQPTRPSRSPTTGYCASTTTVHDPRVVSSSTSPRLRHRSVGGGCTAAILADAGIRTGTDSPGTASPCAQPGAGICRRGTSSCRTSGSAAFERSAPASSRAYGGLRSGSSERGAWVTRVVCAAGLEPATTGFQGRDSTRLSYAQIERPWGRLAPPPGYS